MPKQLPLYRRKPLQPIFTIRNLATSLLLIELDIIAHHPVWPTPLNHPGKRTVSPKGFFRGLPVSVTSSALVSVHGAGGIGHFHQAVLLKLLGDLPRDHAKKVLAKGSFRKPYQAMDMILADGHLLKLHEKAARVFFENSLANRKSQTRAQAFFESFFVGLKHHVNGVPG